MNINTWQAGYLITDKAITYYKSKPFTMRYGWKLKRNSNVWIRRVGVLLLGFNTRKLRRLNK